VTEPMSPRPAGAADVALTDLPWTTGTDPAVLNGAKGRKCRHPRRARFNVSPAPRFEGDGGEIASATCGLCGHNFYAAVSRRSRNNGKRGRRAELTIAREIPGARKMGPLGLPWDVEVGTYARLQVKKLVSRPSANAIRKLIEAIPNTGDRLRGFVWVEAAGRGKRGRREVWFLGPEFDRRHGIARPGPDALVFMPLDEWVAEYVA
jgi:hypothetical protein